MVTRLFLAFLISLMVPATRAGDWQVDPDLAQRLAAMARQDLFLLFTGTNWCGSCVQFEEQILRKPEFIAGSSTFVRVKLEFPASEDKLSPEQHDSYIAWRDRFGIRAYPTVILADPDGRPYAMTGFDDEGTPTDFLRKLDRLHLARDQRDAAFAHAARSTGLARARALDDALAAIRDASDPSLAVSNGELVVRYYRPQIDEVIALDPDNAVGLRDRYRTLLSTDENQARLDQILRGINLIFKEKGAKAALTQFEAELSHFLPGDFRSQLAVSRLFYLESAGEFEAMRAFAAALAAEPDRAPAERRRLKTRVAFALIQLGRVDEAIEVYDDLIAEAGTDRDAAYRILRSKGDLLVRARPAAAIDALGAASLLVGRDTMNWLDVVVPRARILAREQRYDEAIVNLDDALTLNSLSALLRTVILAQKALALAQAGRRDAALACARLAEAALPGLTTAAEAEGDTVRFIRSMLESAHDKVDGPQR